MADFEQRRVGGGVLERRIGVDDERNDLEKEFDDVSPRRGGFVVELQGKPIAVVVPIDYAQRFRRLRDDFFDRAAAAGRRTEMSLAEAEQLVAEAVKAVRPATPRAG